MYPLFLYFQSTNQLNLDGQDPAETVIRSYKYNAGSAPSAPLSTAWRGAGGEVVSSGGEVVSEILELILEGPTAQIEAKIQQLEQILNFAGREAIPRDWVYLRYFDQPSAYDWRSRILLAWVELAGKGLLDRDTESQLVKIHLTRLNYWAGAMAKATAFRTATTKGNNFRPGDIDPGGRYPITAIASCEDAGHTNLFGICGHAAFGDLPGPVELWIENTSSADLYGSFTLSQRIIRGTGRTDCGFIEGEDLTPGDSVTLTTLEDVTCSASYYGSFAFTDSAEQILATWTPSPADLAIMRGQVHRPIMRLQEANTYADLWMCVKILSGTLVLQQSLWMLVPVGTLYVELPSINIPPNLAGFDNLQTVDVALFVRRTAGGSSSLSIDFVQFTPAEIIRRLTSLSLPLPVGQGQYLVDSGIDQVTYFQDLSGARLVSHVGQGSFLQVVPGYDSMIRVLHRVDGDAVWTVTSEFTFHVWYEPRRRNL